MLFFKKPFNLCFLYCILQYENKFERYFCILKTQIKYFDTISDCVNALDYDQLYILFEVYLQLDTQFDFFMSEDNHINFMNFFYETTSKYQPETFKSLISLLTTIYTDASRYPDVLKAIYMIKNGYSLLKIINTIYNNQ